MENYFGKNYTSSGEVTSDYLIKTRGDVVVQTGRKFVKLISAGKINIDVDVVGKVSSKDEINKDGIYFVEDEGSIYISIGDQLYLVYQKDSEEGYVSYLVNQELLPKDKNIAQSNIGLVEKDLLSQEEYQDYGIVYDIATDSMYVIKNGKPIRLEFDIPEVINHRIFINGGSDKGAFIIMGSGSENRLSISDDFLKIYVEDGKSIFDSEGDIEIKIKDIPIVSIVGDNILINENYDLKVNEINSIDGNFKIIDENGESTLYIDNIVTKSSEITYEELITKIGESQLVPGKQYTVVDFQNEWEIIRNPDIEDEFIIIESDIYEVDENGEILYHDDKKLIPKIKFHKNIHHITITATDVDKISKEIEYTKEGWKALYDVTPRWIDYDGDDDDVDKLLDLEYKGVITKLTDEYNNTVNFDFKNLRFYYKDEEEENPEFKFYYLFNGEYGNDASLLGSINNNTIVVNNPSKVRLKLKDNPNYEQNTEEENTTNEYPYLYEGVTILDEEGINVIFKQLVSYTNINSINKDSIFKYKLEQINASTLSSVKFEDDLRYVNFNGNVEDYLFEKEKYPLLYQSDILKDVYRNGDFYNVIFIPDLMIPSGVIVMWNKGDIPSGWVICDGTKGTPDLVDKFIKASNVSGEEGGSNTYNIGIENMPSHKHNVEITTDMSESTELDLDHAHNLDVATSSFGSGEEMKPLLFNTFNSRKYKTDVEELKGNIASSNIEIDIKETGEGKPLTIEPKYYSMIFIMKL